MTPEFAKQNAYGEIKDTGIFCMLAVAKLLGISADEEKIRGLVGDGNTPVNKKKLLQAAAKLQMNAEFVSINLEDLPKQSIPAIAVMKNENYIVLGRNNEHQVVVLDLAVGHSTTLNIQQFASEWTGELILLSRKFSLRNIGQYFHIDWFIPAIKKYQKLFLEVVVASFCLQIFGLVVPLFTQVIIDKVIVHHGVATLDVLAFTIIILAIFQLGLGFLRTYLLSHTTNKIDVILGIRLFRHVASLPLRYFEQRRVGDTLTRVQAMNGIREFLTGSSTNIILDTLFSVVFIMIMFYYSPSLTAVALAAVPLLFLQNIIATPIYHERLKQAWAAGAENNAFLVETVTGIHTLKSLALEPQFNYRWEQLLARQVTKNFDNSTFNMFISNSTSLIQKISSLSILWFGGHLVIEGQLTIGQFIAFQMLSSQATAPLLRLSGMWQSMQQTILSVERLGDIINTPAEARVGNLRGTKPLQGHLQFENVVFRYNPESFAVLDEVSFEITAGTKIGIVGRSGSGKSTVAKLVQRLYLPEAGRIMIDGQDIMKIDPEWLRRNIGVVLQENYLFNGSVRDNIAITRPSASINEVILAAQLAGAHEFILELAEGYDTSVGERGMALSGGQRQRIAIARALLNNPSVLVFDEATSALDVQTEQFIMHNMNKITEGRTTMIIAHRLSTVKNCDKIFVLDQGKIIEQGTHAELMALGGFYHRLYSIQHEVK